MDNTIAGVPPVEKEQQGDEGANPETPEANPYAEELAARDAEIERLRENNLNLTKGIRKAKGKEEDDEDDDDEGRFTPEKFNHLIDQRIEERLNDKSLREAEAAKQAVVDKVLKENAELKRTLASKGTPNPSQAAGSNLDKPEVTTQFFSPEQEAALKARGLDPKDVQKNIPNKDSVAGAPQGGAGAPAV